MEKFRNLSQNIFFKIFLAFLGLTFIIFGVSDFILNNSSSWIAKIKGQKLQYSQFSLALQEEREAIYRSSPSEETLKYLDSAQFKNEVLEKMITKSLIKSLSAELGIKVSEELILKEITQNPNLKDKSGKFDRTVFKNFLARNHLTESKYIQNVKAETAGSMIIYPLIQSSPINLSLAEAFYKYLEEKRRVDVLTISLRNLPEVANPSELELNEFFEKNKDKFLLPQMRQVSYLMFSKNDLVNFTSPSEEEIKQEYEHNLNKYQKPESRNFYHILFDKKEEADNFLEELKKQASDTASNSKISPAAFSGLSAKLLDKNESLITLNNITKTELLKELAEPAFALDKNQYSNTLQSQLGFHIFYVTSIIPPSPLPLAQVKKDIANELSAERKENILRQKLNEIEDSLLANNSLSLTAQKFNLKLKSDLPKFNSNGLDSSGRLVKQTKELENFLENSFKLSQNQASKLYHSPKQDEYYAVVVEKIEESRQRNIDEVKGMVTDLLIKEKKQQQLKELSEKIMQDLKERKSDIATIANRNGWHLDKNREFPRSYMVEVEDGHKVPYTNKFLENIFNINKGEVSNPYQATGDEFVIGVVKEIISPASNQEAINNLTREMAISFRNEVLAEYNKYIQNKFKVEINKKLLERSEK